MESSIFFANKATNQSYDQCMNGPIDMCTRSATITKRNHSFSEC